MGTMWPVTIVNVYSVAEEGTMSAKKRRAVRSGSPVDDQAFVKATADAKRRYGRFNLAIIGNTGVGKSSLVNAVFGRSEAAVGQGMPVTRGVRYYHDDSLGIWDFEGFEIGSAASPQELLRSHLNRIAEGPESQQIAVVWYCVLHNADRLTQPDIDMIRELDAAGLPVVLVLTKVDWKKNTVTGKLSAPESTESFKEWLENPINNDGEPVDLPIQHVALTSTQDSKRQSNKRQGSKRKDTGHGLGELVEETLALAPGDTKDSFRIAQRLNLPWKRDMARRVIAGGAASAAGAAAVPIPVADAATLAPIQMTMMGRIATIYDLELTSMLSASALAQLAAQFSGQALARSFIKLIPVAGSVVNASVASAITAATGEAWMRLCEKVHTGDLEISKVSGALDDFGPTIRSVLVHLLTPRKKEVPAEG